MREFVYDFCRNIPVDLQFRIDDISAGRSVGVIWYVPSYKLACLPLSRPHRASLIVA